MSQEHAGIIVLNLDMADIRTLSSAEMDFITRGQHERCGIAILQVVYRFVNPYKLPEVHSIVFSRANDIGSLAALLRRVAQKYSVCPGFALVLCQPEDTVAT